jgi:Na+-transporting methylmalonyl-CoA/oxaloacetate decarboxylase gamma subunit
MDTRTTWEVLQEAFTYSCIAFSIVFIVLGMLTGVIYAMRLVTSKGTPAAPGSGEKAKVSAAGSAPQANTTSGSGALATGAPAVKSRHVAAITAAILAATQGRGRILSIAPAGARRNVTLEATRLWRTVGIAESVGRRLPPTWKR